jgi:hypothetical protein
VTATLVGPTGQTLATLLTAPKPAGAQTLAFTPPPGLANGQYAIAVSVTSGAKVASASVPFVLDDILGAFSATGPTLSFTLTRAPVSVAFQVLDAAGAVVAVPATPPAVAGPQVLTWDGTLADGSHAPDGTYALALTVGDEFTTFTRTAPLTLDRTAPVITVLSYRNLRFRISEPATLTLVVGANRYVRMLKNAATTQFWLRTKPTVYRLIARDAAGNSSVVRYRR